MRSLFLTGYWLEGLLESGHGCLHGVVVRLDTRVLTAPYELNRSRSVHHVDGPVGDCVAVVAVIVLCGDHVAADTAPSMAYCRKLTSNPLIFTQD